MLLKLRERNWAAKVSARFQSSPVTSAATALGQLLLEGFELGFAGRATSNLSGHDAGPPVMRSGGVEELELGGVHLVLDDEGAVLDPPQSLAGAEGGDQ